MFTPPPSPLPVPLKNPPHATHSVSSSLPSLPLSHHHRSVSLTFRLSSPPAPTKYAIRKEYVSALALHDRKRRTGWRTYTMAIMFPLLLVLVTLSTRYFTLSRPMYLVAGPYPEFRPNAVSASGANSLHRRQSGPSADPSELPASTSTPSGILFPSLSMVSSSIPPTSTQSISSTIPTAPTSSPVLPTPFPQPFDTTFANNFTTISCQNSFTNMTQSLPFRQCRPFSFLSQTSSAFLQVSDSYRLSKLYIDVDARLRPRTRHKPTLRLSTSMSGVLVTPPSTWISAQPTWVGFPQTSSPHVPRRKMNKIKWFYRHLLVYTFSFPCDAILALE